MEEVTEKEERGELYHIILKNCYSIHPRDPLPPIPYFLETQSAASMILKEILTESSFDHKKFAKKASTTLVHYKALREKENLSRASLLLESLDIAKTMKEVEKLGNLPTNLQLKVEKSQSTRGPLIVSIRLASEKHDLEEGDTLEIAVNRHDNFIIKFLYDEGQKMHEMGEVKISLNSVIEGFHYLKTMEKGELDSSINKKGSEYEVKLNIKLRLSRNDRLEILTEKQLENEHELVDNEGQNEKIYKAMLKSLNISDLDNQYQTTIKQRESRDCYCLLF